jgi:hypothetical protein
VVIDGKEIETNVGVVDVEEALLKAAEQLRKRKLPRGDNHGGTISPWHAWELHVAAALDGGFRHDDALHDISHAEVLAVQFGLATEKKVSHPC